MNQTYRNIPVKYLSMAYDAIMVLLVGFAFLFSVGRELGVARLHFAQCILVVLSAALFAFWLNRSKAEQLWGLLFALAAAGVLHLLVGIGKMMQFWGDYWNWLMRGVTPESGVQWFQALQCLWTILIVSILWQAVKKFTAVDYVLAVLGPVLTMQSFWGGYVLNKQAVAFWLVTALSCLSGIVQNHWDKQRNAGEPLIRNRCYRLFLMPAFLLMLVIMLALPVKDTPLEWTTVKNMFARVEEKWITFRVNGGKKLRNDFQINMSGLSENVSVEGASHSAPQTYMTLHFSKTPDTNLYLTGYYWKTFDGRDWSDSTRIAAEADSSDQTCRDVRMDTLETLYAINLFGGREEDYVKYTQTDSEVKYFHSDSMFLPIKLLSASEPEGLVGKTDQYLGYGSSYGFSFLQLNLNSPGLYALLEQGHEEDEQVWNEINYYRKGDGPIFDYEELLDYRARMREEYLSELTLGEAAKAWLEEAYAAAAAKVSAGGSDALNDWQKLAAIEQQLAGFTYTKTPGELPKKVDSPEQFLDYFLVESQIGYCTHFASAFVLLARAEGYPARLCQGFCTPVRGAKDFSVLGSDAHAWPEVYFEGFGWVPFEPTPGYYELRYTPWAAREKIDGQSAEWLAYFAKQEEIRRLEEEKKRAEQQVQLAEELEDNHRMEEILAMVMRVGIGILSLLVLGVCLYFLYYLMQARRVRKMSESERFEWLSGTILKQLNQLALQREGSETLEEYGKRLARAGYAGTKTLQNLELVRYGNADVTAEMNRDAWKELAENRSLQGKAGGVGINIIIKMNR